MSESTSMWVLLAPFFLTAAAPVVIAVIALCQVACPALRRALRPGTGTRRQGRSARRSAGCHVPLPPVAWPGAPDPFEARWRRWRERARRAPMPPLAREEHVWGSLDGARSAWEPPKPWERHIYYIDGTPPLVRPYVTIPPRRPQESARHE